MSVSRPPNHSNSCSCAVCVKIRSPKSTKILLTIHVTQHEYMQEYAKKVGVSTAEAIRTSIDYFKNNHPLDKVVKPVRVRTLLEVLTEEDS